jgi:hypothetical protein
MMIGMKPRSINPGCIAQTAKTQIKDLAVPYPDPISSSLDSSVQFLLFFRHVERTDICSILIGRGSAHVHSMSSFIGTRP